MYVFTATITILAQEYLACEWFEKLILGKEEPKVSWRRPSFPVKLVTGSVSSSERTRRNQNPLWGATALTSTSSGSWKVTSFEGRAKGWVLLGATTPRINMEGECLLSQETSGFPTFKPEKSSSGARNTPSATTSSVEFRACSPTCFPSLLDSKEETTQK